MCSKGISDGSEIIFDWVYFWIYVKLEVWNLKIFLIIQILALNLRVELLHLATASEFNVITRKQDTTMGCSDFFLIDEKNVSRKQWQNQKTESNL